MKPAFNFKTGLIGGVGAILGCAAGVAVLLWAKTDGHVLEGELARRDRALATFISGVKAADAATRDEALDKALKAALGGRGAEESPLVYAALISSSGRVQRAWLNRQKVKKLFPGQKAASAKEVSALLNRLLTGKITRKGLVKEYSVQLPEMAGTVKIGFDVTRKAAENSSLWLKASVIFAAAVLLGFGIFMFLGGRVGGGAVERATVALRDAIEMDPKGLGLTAPGVKPGSSPRLGAGLEKTILHGAEELEKWRNRFSDVAHHVPRPVVEALVLDRRLGTDERAVTAIRVELRGMQERMLKKSARECLDLANSYLDLVVETLRAHGAVVGQVQPDGVLAWWGAPEVVRDAEGKAVFAALQLREKTLDESKRKMAASEEGLGTAVAIATGRSVAGRVGSSGRMHYTIVGTPVLTANALARQAGEGEVLVCAITMDLLGKDRFRVVQHNAVGPDGKQAHKLVALAGSTMEFRPG